MSSAEIGKKIDTNLNHCKASPKFLSQTITEIKSAVTRINKAIRNYLGSRHGKEVSSLAQYLLNMRRCTLLMVVRRYVHEIIVRYSCGF